jgi:DNA phosphorothioation-dependent restriction protein DptG
MMQEDARTVATAAYQYQLALLSNGSLADDSFKKTSEHAKNAFNDIWNSVYPWAETDSATQQEQLYTDLMESYREQFGDPDDPEVLRKLEEGVKQFYDSRRQRRTTEDDDQRLERMLLERDERIRSGYVK